jgi:hypothetical protein
MILGSASAVPPAGYGTMMRMVALGYVATSSAAADETAEIVKINLARHLAAARAAAGEPKLENDRAIMVFWH